MVVEITYLCHKRYAIIIEMDPLPLRFKYLFLEEKDPRGLIDVIKAREYAAFISKLALRQHEEEEKYTEKSSSRESESFNYSNFYEILWNFLRSNTYRYIIFVLSFITLDVFSLLKRLVHRVERLNVYEQPVFNMSLEILIELKQRDAISRKIQLYRLKTNQDEGMQQRFQDYVDNVCPLMDCFPENVHQMPLNKHVRVDSDILSMLTSKPQEIYVSVPHYQQFVDQFEIFSRRVLRNVTWNLGESSRVVVAGGSVVAALTMYAGYTDYLAFSWTRRILGKLLPQIIVRYIMDLLELDGNWFVRVVQDHFSMKWSESDIDLFVMATSLDDAKKHINLLLQEITPCIPVDYMIVHTDRSITIAPEYPYRPIQLITSIQNGPQDLLIPFDLDCVAFVYEPTYKHVFTLDRGIRAFNTSINVIPTHLWPKSGSRAFKYETRGFHPLPFYDPKCMHNTVCCDHRSDLNQYRHRTFYKSHSFPYHSGIEAVEAYCREKKLTYFSRLDTKFEEYFNSKIQFDWSHNYDAVIWKFNCYQCNTPLPEELVSTVHVLCEPCRQVNEDKWNQWDEFKFHDKKYALVTGGRSKIGFETVLRLLRSGIHVITTTRYQLVTQVRYAKELDYEKWADRLFIFMVDFSKQNAVESLVKFVKSKCQRLDILINNAIVVNRTSSKLSESLRISEQRMVESIVYANEMMDQEDDECNNKKTDVNLDQMLVGEMLDNMSIDEDEPFTFESVIDIQKINTVVPIQLITQLSSIMGGTSSNNQYSCIVNLSSNGGSNKKSTSKLEASDPGNIEFFSNLSVARKQLNSITCSLASGYLARRIYICAVDPGWVAKKIPYSNILSIGPLKMRDGASRILDPIYKRLQNISQYESGVLFKNYIPVKWNKK
ncbi:hypothetical protein PPL_12148 [Heterostelium album PN500]|uniref:Uncharacterized protein n=1 Tax=Heterostelium pallidum (strain ATCC 26659 / Pp 5 / PN500) TaxID=670386 RepID=D3BLU4_HETP5|nr:hypothetical protein PPL_12148 [Heterostelium album PN500]EFA77545.1 hypothetical protein PPL_12148 [Heterostelium album PN500]|eukprot:XP_020429673.1 hypothetical protein PPL_12148 [Heterostelium album PN500]